VAFRAGPCLDTETVSEPAAENLTLRNDLFLFNSNATAFRYKTCGTIHIKRRTANEHLTP